MKKEVVALKVKIGLRYPKGNREADHPDFNLILKDRNPPIDIDWSYWIAQFGDWQYDKQCGHNEADNTSPFGMQWGMIYVPRWFADAACIMFPEQCSIMLIADSKAFHEDRAHGHEPDVMESVAVLQGIAAKRNAGIPEDDDDRAALDPETRTPGRRKNRNKKQADFLQTMNLEIEE